MADIGIRREDKSRWERRTPLTPLHVEELVGEQGRSVAVQPSPLRIFGDEEYAAAGARVTEDLSGCRVLLGVKEIPPERLLAGKPHLSFFHVVKGQEQNMPTLARALASRCSLIDYERIVDRHGQRMIFFGRHAGYAGMIGALAALGRRAEVEGIETPFAAVGPAWEYPSVDAAEEFLVSEVGRQIREAGVPRQLHPLVVGLTGGGNVSQGAQEVLERLPVVEVHPDELAALADQPGLSRRTLYKVVFRREHRVDFAPHLPHLTVLVNAVYWEPGQRRLISRRDVERLWGGSEPPKLRVIADLSCDIEGSVEVTVESTGQDAPTYVYEAASGTPRPGVEGRGPVILAVDNLPAEFPRDASEHFGDSLFPFLEGLLAADFSAPFEHLTLPTALVGSVVTHDGELTPRYRYLTEHLPPDDPGQGEGSAGEGAP